MKKFFSPASLIQSAIALALIALCLLASQWQFHRGQGQSRQNAIISHNVQAKTVTLKSLEPIDPLAHQWRNVSLTGQFDLAHQELIRNRYFQGKYGFEVLQLFRADGAHAYWVDRGWVAPGIDAKTPPLIPEIKSEYISINARIRSENLSHQLQGSFFATTARKDLPDISNLQGTRAANYYLDLLDADQTWAKPLTQISIPELTNGPHFAYALQWLAFAVLILIGRIALFREFKR
jgi:cytochrome oxidase assembly protein ShyY1